jgi:S-DNA-T family DNA segregation ATPase FtsK/SpoIIIE
VRLQVSYPDPAAGERRLDVEVDDRVPVGALRQHLVRLTGWPGWRVEPFVADGTVLDDTHPAGVPPLCHGALVGVRRTAPPDAVRAAVARWHLAVVVGPDSGALLVPTGAGPRTVGPGGDLCVRDDAWPVPVLVRAARQARAARRSGRGAGPRRAVCDIGRTRRGIPGASRSCAWPRRWARP